jgi:hypothetical protein
LSRRGLPKKRLGTGLAEWRSTFPWRLRSRLTVRSPGGRLPPGRSENPALSRSAASDATLGSCLLRRPTAPPLRPRNQLGEPRKSEQPTAETAAFPRRPPPDEPRSRRPRAP